MKSPYQILYMSYLVEYWLNKWVGVSKEKKEKGKKVPYKKSASLVFKFKLNMYIKKICRADGFEIVHF